MWPRLVEPRLTGSQWRPCNGPECGRTASPAEAACPEIIHTHREALGLLTHRLECTDNAIEALKLFASTDARAWSDIAAAYYLRAHRDGRESDLLQALETAERAVAETPDDPAARFNLALIQEKLGLSEMAIASWEAVLKTDTSEWKKEAQDHLERLRMPDAAMRWADHQVELAAALRVGNRAIVRKLIAEFPTPAIKYYERERDSAKLLASELLLRLGYDPEISAGIERAGELAVAGESDRALTILEPLERKARDYSLAHVQSMRAYNLQRQSRHLQALAAYGVALNTFAHLNDPWQIVSARRNRVGIFRTMGQYELAFHEAMDAMKSLPDVVDIGNRQMTLTETAETAAALGYPKAAMHYQNAAIRLLQKHLVSIPPGRLGDIANAMSRIGSARRIRASIELQLGRYDDAENDLDEANRLMAGDAADATSLRKALRVGVDEARGQSLLRIDPNRASQLFTAALTGIPKDELRTRRATLLAQRAEAELLAGRATEAEHDLQRALRELREEESRVLDERQRGQGEEYWSAYFSRFEKTYDRLIWHLVESDQWEKAFDYDEQSRSYEPLDLILKLDVAPPAFRKLVPRGEPMSLAAIRAQLPPGTVLLQYAVLEDTTSTWIISRESASHLVQDATRNDVERWSEQLQRAVRQRDANSFYRVSTAVFDKLMAQPLDEIAKRSSRPQRLVIVPDRRLHGLPFAALYDTRTHQYLIEKAPIEIAGSATLYIFSRTRDEALPRAARQSALLIGDPDFKPIDLARGLKRLPRAREEVEQIRELYSRAMDVAVRTGADATVDEFLALARNRTIVHVAGHSIVNPNQPWQSVLLLAQSGDDSGAIDAAELVRRLKLDRTRLVVLAACSSAGGFPVGPEGVAPLVRPLIAAGVPAVMGSLWDVEDATAEALSVSFHRRYGQGDDAATALQAAQVDMLRNGTSGLPSVLVWAPFQVIGHASSPFEPAQ